MYSALKVAPGREMPPPATPEQDFVPRRGPAGLEIEGLARDAMLAANGTLTFEQAYALAFSDPKNRELRERVKLEERNVAAGKPLAAIQGEAFIENPIRDAIRATRPTIKVEDAPSDPEPEFIGPAHARLHSLAVDHMRAHPGQTYAGSYTYLYSHKDNADLRAKVRAEHMRATMAGVTG
ncbi:hypothetical protein [Methylocapsa palsarum]|nr:hypothetical protein [Methylocapsa palsarum]